MKWAIVNPKHRNILAWARLGFMTVSDKIPSYKILTINVQIINEFLKIQETLSLL